MSSEQGLRNIKWSHQTIKKYMRMVVMKKGKPFINNKEVIMPDDVETTLKQAYRNVAANSGILRFMSYLNQRYYGIHRKEAFQWLKDQEPYQKYQALSNPSHSKAQVVRGPGVKFAMDHKKWQTSGPPHAGYTGALFVIDMYSRKLWVFPHRGDETALTNKRALEQLFDDELGEDKLPRVILMDNGSNFLGICREYIEGKGIKIVNSDPRRPASNGAAERVINTISRFLMSTAYARYGSQAQWPRCLDSVVHYYNTTRHRVLGNKTPNEVWETGVPEQALTDRMKAEAARRRNSRLYTEKARILRPGDHVLLSKRISSNTSSQMKSAIVSGIRKKYLDQWDTSRVYTIEKKIGTNFYRLVEARGNYDRVDLLKIPTYNPKQFERDN